MIAIIDYGAGNLFNIENAVRKMGANVIVTNDLNEILMADGIILPGVGYAKSAMNYLREKKLVDIIEKKVLVDRIPFLGICLGMQLMFEHSEEGNADCFGWIKGNVEKIDMSPKVPQIGWNNIRIVSQSDLLQGINDNEDFYFIHSYCVKKCLEEAIVTTTEYGCDFVSMVQKDNMFGTQFHPEKSGEVGWRLIKNYCELVNKNIKK